MFVFYSVRFCNTNIVIQNFVLFVFFSVCFCSTNIALEFFVLFGITKMPIQIFFLLQFYIKIFVSVFKYLFKCLLASKFEMKDMGVANVILGVKYFFYCSFTLKYLFLYSNICLNACLQVNLK